MSKEYIERSAVMPAIEMAVELYNSEYNDIEHNINAIPAADVVEVVHGRWISDEADVLFHCSECEAQISTSWDYDDLRWNYCPNCGAKMDGKEHNNA